MTEINEHASVPSDLIMPRARKGVAPEKKGATPQNELGSDPTAELVVKFIAIIDERSKGVSNDYNMRNSPAPTCVQRTRMTINTTEENKFFHPGGKHVFFVLPSKRIPLAGRA